MKEQSEDTHRVSSPSSAAEDEAPSPKDKHATDSSTDEPKHHRGRSQSSAPHESPRSSSSSQNDEDSDVEPMSDQTLPPLPRASSRSPSHKSSSEGSSSTMRALSSDADNELHPYSQDLSSDILEPAGSCPPEPSDEDQLSNSDELTQADISDSDGDSETES